MTFGINTTRDISKLSQISLAQRLVKLCITISKYHPWYLCQISLEIMPLLIQILENGCISFNIGIINTTLCASCGDNPIIHGLALSALYSPTVGCLGSHPYLPSISELLPALNFCGIVYLFGPKTSNARRLGVVSIPFTPCVVCRHVCRHRM